MVTLNKRALSFFAIGAVILQGDVHAFGQPLGILVCNSLDQPVIVHLSFRAQSKDENISESVRTVSPGHTANFTMTGRVTDLYAESRERETRIKVAALAEAELRAYRPFERKTWVIGTREIVPVPWAESKGNGRCGVSAVP